MRRLSITTKLVLSSAFILIGVGFVVTAYSVSQLRTLLYKEMVRRVEAQTQNWVEANIFPITLAGNRETLGRLVVELNKREGISYVILLDAHGKPRAATRALDELTVESSGTEGTGSGMQWREVRDTRGLRYFELSAPISASGTGMSPDLETMFRAVATSPNQGEIRVGVDRQRFYRSVRVLVAKNIALAAVLIMLAVGLRFLLAKQMVTPLVLMVKAANQIAAGNLSERVQAGVKLQDEVGDLVRNFNRMALRLEEDRKEMSLLYSSLEGKVQERTKELEQANRKLQELDQLKSDFLSTVSHELRTPLTSIKAYAEILLDSTTLDNDRKGRFLGIIEKESDRMSRLISDLLNLAKIESGTAALELTNADLRDIIRQSAEALAPYATQKGITLKTAESGPQLVFADVDRIQEVVTNLLSNAVKFCSGGGQIQVRLDRVTTSGPQSERAGEYVRVLIADTGPGLSAEERERVFEKFYGSGTGLGLTISREIVLHHQGEIWVESEPGVGSSFYFTLPLRALGGTSSVCIVSESGEKGV